MDVTSCLKHLAKYWDVYWFVAEEPRTKAEIKEYLMEECYKAESTARVYLNAMSECELLSIDVMRMVPIIMRCMSMIERDGFDKKRIGRITFMDVQNFYNAMLEQDRMLATTLESIHTQIHPALQYAVRLRYIPTNPSSGAMTDIKKSEEWDGRVRKRHALTKDQQMAFADCYTNHKDLSGWANIMTFLLGTGCHIGEALGMTWQDIDFENSLVHVNKALLYRPDDQGMKKETIPTQSQQ